MWQTLLSHIWCLLGALLGGALIGHGLRGLRFTRQQENQGLAFQEQLGLAHRERDANVDRARVAEGRVALLEPLQGQLQERDRSLAEISLDRDRLRNLPPQIIERLVEKVVDRPVEKIVEKIVTVEKPVTVEKIVEVEKIVTRIDETQIRQLRSQVGDLDTELNRLRAAPPRVVEKIVTVEKPVTVEKIVEVEKIVTRIDETQVNQLRSRVSDLEAELNRLRSAPPKTVEKIVEVEKIVTRIDETLVNQLRGRVGSLEDQIGRLRSLPPTIIEKIVEVEKPVIVEKIVEVERIVEIKVPAKRARRRTAPIVKSALAKRASRPRRKIRDDLKLIYGVGPKLEKFLNRKGITLFRQVARWQRKDIDMFEADLPEFKGRIRREGWVASAKSEHRKKYGRDV